MSDLVQTFFFSFISTNDVNYWVCNNKKKNQKINKIKESNYVIREGFIYKIRITCKFSIYRIKNKNNKLLRQITF